MLGSSKNYPNVTKYDGIFLNDSSNYFADWTKVYLKYCDGALHQGYRK